MAVTQAPPQEQIQGVIPMDESHVRFQRLMILMLALLPLAGFLGAIVTLWGRGISGVDLGLLIGFYVFSGIGVTVGFHRLLTHRSFETPNWVRGLFAVAGTMSIEGSVIKWVADHRRHHAYSDKEGDPHSPHLEDGALRGLWHAHFGWLFKKEFTDERRWAPDMLKDPLMVRIDRLAPWIVTASLVLPAALGLALTGTLWGAVTGFLWGGLARVFVLNHVTFSINSICHFFGSRPFNTSDEARNNWALAILSFGESWHNNHHAFQTSAFLGLKPWQVDPGRYTIRTLQFLGLAYDVKEPTAKQLERRS